MNRLVEVLFLIVPLFCCTGGVSWLIWDIRQQIKNYK